MKKTYIYKVCLLLCLSSMFLPIGASKCKAQNRPHKVPPIDVKKPMVPTTAPDTEIVPNPQTKGLCTQQPSDSVAPVAHEERQATILIDVVKHGPVFVDAVRQSSKATADYIHRIEQWIMQTKCPTGQANERNMEDHLSNDFQNMSHKQKPNDLNGACRVQYSFEAIAMEIALVVMIGADVCLCHSQQSMDLVAKDLQSIKNLLHALLGSLDVQIAPADLTEKVSCIKNELIKVRNSLVPMLDNSVLEVAKNYIMEVTDAYLKASHNIDPYVVTKDPYVFFKDLLDHERFCQLYAPTDVLKIIQNATLAFAATSAAKVAVESISLEKKTESVHFITEMCNGIHAVTSIEEIKQRTWDARDKIWALCDPSNGMITEESLDGREANASLKEVDDKPDILDEEPETAKTLREVEEEQPPLIIFDEEPETAKTLREVEEEQPALIIFDEEPNMGAILREATEQKKTVNEE